MACKTVTSSATISSSRRSLLPGDIGVPEKLTIQYSRLISWGLLMLIEGTYQINFFRVGVMWFWKGVQKNSNATRMYCKKLRKGLVYFVRKWPMGLCGFLSLPRTRFWNLGCNQSGAELTPNHPHIACSRASRKKDKKRSLVPCCIRSYSPSSARNGPLAQGGFVGCRVRVPVGSRMFTLSSGVKRPGHEAQS
jgi:hypothetical protein